MSHVFYAVFTQSLTFLPLAVGITISYRLLRATDMTLDGSFVLGAAVFARLVTLGVSPIFAGILALFAGSLAGVMVSLIQKGGRVDPLLAGVLATFILTSGNLIIMGRPNINLLSAPTLLSGAFAKSDLSGWLVVAAYCFGFCVLSYLLIRSRFGLMLRALGDNPDLLKRLGNPVEYYRIAGFAFTNLLAAAAGILTAQTVGYADISMGFGMTLTGIGAIILGQQILRVFVRSANLRALAEFSACLLGVLLYFFAINILLRMDIDPVYLKMLLGLVLILFLRTAVNPTKLRKMA
jgi:putative tryptophan/tyrosine transport system permease protein